MIFSITVKIISALLPLVGERARRVKFEGRSFEEAKNCRSSEVALPINSNLQYLHLQSIYYTILGWPEKDLNNELCVVTGGGGGLGRLLAMRLSRVGVKVILWDINQEGKWIFKTAFQVAFKYDAWFVKSVQLN